MNFSKNTWKYDIFFKYFEKTVFQKKIALEYDFTFIIRKDGFSRIYDNFSIAENGNLVKRVLLFPTHIKLPFCKKSKDDLLPKNTSKMILILEKMILAF